MDWKQSLDRYLTNPPEDGYDSFANHVIEKEISDSFFNANEDWILEHNGLFDKWCYRLFSKKGKSPKETAKIIERAFKLFNL